MQPKVGDMLGIRSALVQKRDCDQITDKKLRTVCFDESRNEGSGQNCNEIISETYSSEDVTPKFSTTKKGDASQQNVIGAHLVAPNRGEPSFGGGEAHK